MTFYFCMHGWLSHTSSHPCLGHFSLAFLSPRSLPGFLLPNDPSSCFVFEVVNFKFLQLKKLWNYAWLPSYCACGNQHSLVHQGEKEGRKAVRRWERDRDRGQPPYTRSVHCVHCFFSSISDSICKGSLAA